MTEVVPNISEFSLPAGFGHSWQKVCDLFSCKHEVTELRCKTNSAGVRNYRKQCRLCGALVETVKARSLTLAEKDSAPDWDEALRERWDAAKIDYHQQQKQQERERESAEFWDWYGAYLQTPEWKRRRDLVFQRANGICEGCRSVPASFVHHLTYGRRGNELLFDLVAVCGPCHQIAHPDKEIITESPYYDPSDLIASNQV